MEEVFRGLRYPEIVTSDNLSQIQILAESPVAKEILSKPCFTRVWVYQELVLSREVLVQYGRTRVKWEDLCSAIVGSPDDSMNTEDDILPHRITGNAIISQMRHARRGVRRALEAKERHHPCDLSCYPVGVLGSQICETLFMEILESLVSTSKVRWSTFRPLITTKVFRKCSWTQLVLL